MKKRRKIFLNIFLLIVLFFFQGINEHSNLDSQRHYIEISHDTDNNESRLNSDDDSSDEDQIDQYNNPNLSEQLECKKYRISNLPLLNILFFSIWQPPKVL